MKKIKKPRNRWWHRKYCILVHLIALHPLPILYFCTSVAGTSRNTLQLEFCVTQLLSKQCTHMRHVTRHKEGSKGLLCAKLIFWQNTVSWFPRVAGASVMEVQLSVPVVLGFEWWEAVLCYLCQCRLVVCLDLPSGSVWLSCSAAQPDPPGFLENLLSCSANKNCNWSCYHKFRRR